MASLCWWVSLERDAKADETSNITNMRHQTDCLIGLATRGGFDDATFVLLVTSERWCLSSYAWLVYAGGFR